MRALNPYQTADLRIQLPSKKTLIFARVMGAVSSSQAATDSSQTIYDFFAS
jgi:hypothetical protein